MLCEINPLVQVLSRTWNMTLWHYAKLLLPELQFLWMGRDHAGNRIRKTRKRFAESSFHQRVTLGIGYEELAKQRLQTDACWHR
jgi:hypothetical protein